jgi:hypothetical protein
MRPDIMLFIRYTIPTVAPNRRQYNLARAQVQCLFDDLVLLGLMHVM